MGDNVLRSRGRPNSYKFDRGGTPAEMGPYIGIVVNNVDTLRSGRLQVWIAQFGQFNPDGTPLLDNPTTWRTVNYCPPFYGATPFQGTSASYGTYPGNRNSYGMWFTPPDLGTQVLCFFPSGDQSEGYYVGCIPEQGINHMIPAIGASSKYVNSTNNNLFKNTSPPSLPVTEINEQNPQINENPKFYDQPKPIQTVLAAELFQQGLEKDPIRGPIKSSSQRESPSACYGISTPGKPIYQGNVNSTNLKQQLDSGSVKLADLKVTGRQGGHTFVMDDGDIEGKDALIRIRTAKGHQITMSDDGNSFYIIHANGQSWIELGQEGTVDVYSTNSINLRTQGTINMHADLDINMYAGRNFKVKAGSTAAFESNDTMTLNASNRIVAYSKNAVALRADGAMALQSKQGSWNGGSLLNFKATTINLNGAGASSVPAVPSLPGYKLADTTFVANQGWTVQAGKLDTIVTRAPTHEPYPYHNKGVAATTDLNPVPDPTSTSDGSGISPSDQAVVQAGAQPIKNGVTVEQVTTEPAANDSIGSCTKEQVTSMTAQQAAATTAKQEALYGSAYDDDGNLMPGWQLDGEENPYYTGPKIAEGGVGKYGQTPESLVSTGFLKPNTLSLITSPSMTSTVLNSPGVWTGQMGVTSLLGYLGSPIIQNLAQIALMTGAFTGLVDAGVITGSENAVYQATFIQSATVFGVDTVADWVFDTGNLSDAELNNVLQTARQGQYAVTFADAYAEEIAASRPGVAASDTALRNVLDTTVTNIIDNPKIPSPITRGTGNITVPTPAPEDGTFRFAPNNPNR